MSLRRKREMEKEDGYSGDESSERSLQNIRDSAIIPAATEECGQTSAGLIDSVDPGNDHSRKPSEQYGANSSFNTYNVGGFHMGKKGNQHGYNDTSAPPSSYGAPQSPLNGQPASPLNPIIAHMFSDNQSSHGSEGKYNITSPMNRSKKHNGAMKSPRNQLI